MITTTTPSVEGRQITDYFGVVFGEAIVSYSAWIPCLLAYRNRNNHN